MFRFCSGVLAIILLGSVSAARAEIEWSGFVESLTSVRVVDAGSTPPEWGSVPLPHAWDEARDFMMRETRLQIKGSMYGDEGEAHFVVDFLADELSSDDLVLNLREAFLKFNAFNDNLELRVGRQPTTWGTGDLLFINDLFPKDYISFFTGREDQYLKKPSDVLRAGIFGLPFNVDIVYTPKFSPDNTPVGDRLVFWSPMALPVVTPDERVENGEVAVRLNRYYGNINVAAYGYVGFWKNPQGMVFDDLGTPTSFDYPELSVYGASARGGLFGGVFNLEGGYYDSREDPDGDLVNIPNSEVKALAGYERSWWSDFTGGMQVYAERMIDHDVARSALDASFGTAAFMKDETRTLITTRLEQQLREQTLRVSLFAYYSPSDEDSYLRFLTSYRYSDEVELVVGANMFDGQERQTPFGMNDGNDNVFVRVRFIF